LLAAFWAKLAGSRGRHSETMNDRQGSSMRSWVPGIFATFWILLAAFSGAYLFRIVTEPHAGKETAQAEPVAPVQAQAPAVSAEQVSSLVSNNEAKDREIAELRTQIGSLSQQMTELNTRLQPLEKVLGPVAALPSGAAVTTSPPNPEAETLAAPAQEPAKPKLSKQDLAKEEAAKKEAAKKEEAAKQEAAKQEAAKQEAEKEEAAKKEAAKQEAAKAEAAKQEAAKQEAAKQEAAKEEAVRKDAAKQEAAKAEAAKQEAAKTAEQPAEPAMPSVASTPSDATPSASTQVASVDQTSGGTEAPSSSAPVPTDTEGDSAGAAPAATETASVSASAIPIPPGTTRFGIEIGGSDKRDGLRPLWKDLISNHAALVAGLQAKRVLAPDKKWRLVAGPFANVDEATQACGLFKKANLPCEATVFAGDAF
jgi:hypothetical protein